MAAKTAEGKNKKKTILKPLCQKCKGPKSVVKFAALSNRMYDKPMPRGFFWQCEDEKCAFMERV